MNHVLLCSDLDRTLLPNGPQQESPRARRLLQRVAQRPELTLAYVSGRHLKLLQEAIVTYDLPIPDYAVGDVGATIYRVRGGRWSSWSEWEQQIAPDWNGRGWQQIAAMFEDIDVLELQESEKQSRFKLSYYAPEDLDAESLIAEMDERLKSEGIRASLIWSVDELDHQGLLDLLPERATKHHAIRFIMERKGFARDETVFAGDSGNDLPALTSGLQAVLVKNARDAVRRQAQQKMQAQRMPERLYVARGGFLGMNGNYAAGVLEGLVHFVPAAGEWLKS